MPQCPACQHDLDEAARSAGQCPKCGMLLRALPQRTISDRRVPHQADPGAQTVVETAQPTQQSVNPFDVTVRLVSDATLDGSIDLETINTLELTGGALAGSDKTIELAKVDSKDLTPESSPAKTIELEMVESKELGAQHSADKTIDLETIGSAELLGSMATTEPPATKHGTIELAGEATIDLSSAVGAQATGIDVAQLTSQWEAGEHEAGRDPNATIKQKETISGTVATSSSLIVKSRLVRPTGGSEPTTISNAADAPDYELLNVIGEGGMGVVYAARQSSIARTVALKMLKGDDFKNAAQREKFISEAVVTGELDHPNIVPIYDLGSNAEGALFYSMKRVRGTPWNKVIKEKSLDENLDILLRVADAVAFAHVNGVVHRDLKPENTMLGDFGEVLVMDWGLARVSPEFPSAASVAMTSAMGGTPAYMAPEMATGPIEKITAASDIYLLGAMLFEIVTGRPPHSGDTVMACLYNAAKNKITPVDEKKAVQFGELLAVATKAMTTAPEERYQNVQDFQKAIREFQAHSESIMLAAHAQRNLAHAAEAEDYDLFARAVYGLEESLTLWPQNQRSAELLDSARIDYAKLALAKGDFDLGASLLSPEAESHREVLSQLEAGRTERESRQRRIKLLKGAVAALVASVIGIVGLAYKAVSKERDEAVFQRDRAVKAEGEAVENYNAAEVARKDAVEQKDRAVKAEGEAVANFNAAEIARKDAVDQRVRAEVEEAKAKRQRKIAVEARNAEEYAAYVARIGLTKTKIDENAFDRAAELLSQCKEYLRRWEWGRLKRLTELAKRSWTAGAPVDAATFSPDGAHFASGDWNGKAIIWDLATGDRVKEIPQGQYVHSVAYDRDGKRLAVGSSDGVVRVYDTATGEKQNELTGHEDAVLSVRFSPDGKQLLSCGYDNTARLWDIATGKELQDLTAHSWWVWTAEFSPDGSRIVTASQDGKAIVWKASADGTQPYVQLTEFSQHRGPVYAAQFSPDGALVATAGYDGRVLLWNPDVVKPVDIGRRLDKLPDPPADYIELTGHRGPVRTLAFAPDGKALASGGQDNVIFVWDLPNRKPYKELRGHASYVRSIAYSGDGNQLLSGGRDGQIKLWRPAEYAEIESLALDDGVESEDAVLAARFSPDGRKIVTASRNRTASLWDVASLKRLSRLQEGHDFLASTAQFFAQGSRVATGAGDGTVRIWDVETGAEVQRLDGAGRTAALAADEAGQFVATGSMGKDVQIWNAETGENIARLAGHDAEVTSARFSPDGMLLATGDDRGDIRVWKYDPTAATWTGLHDLKGHSRTITSLAFADAGKRLISASGDNTCGQWDVTTGKELPAGVLKHPQYVADMAVSADGQFALTACDDGELRVWSLADAKLLRTLPTPADHPVFTSIDLSPNGRMAAAACAADGTVHVWNIETGREITATEGPAAGKAWLDTGGRGGVIWAARFNPAGDEILTIGGNDARLLDLDDRKLVVRFSPHGAVAGVDVSPDGKRVVTGSWDRTAKIWDADSGKVLHKLEGLHEGYVNSACFSPDGTMVLTASDDGTARLWSVADGKPLEPVFRGHEGRIRQACFSPDGKRIITASGDKTARIWNVATGKPEQTLRGHEWGLTSAAFSEDGRLAITGSEDNSAIVWDVATGKQLQKLAGHTAAVASVALSPDGARALTGSQDNAVKLWDPATGKEILTLAGHADEVTSVSFSPDGLSILTSGRDGKVLVWPAVPWVAPAPREARK